MTDLAVLFVAMLAAPLVLPLFFTRTPSARQRARHARANPTTASRPEAAECRAVTAEPWASGAVMKLPCRECGQRAVPPVVVGESPWIPVELLTLVGAGSRWEIVATCTACYGPLVSRKLDDEEAAHALSIGVFDGVGATH